jgi:cyclic pyranopterin phosphate synthase
MKALGENIAATPKPVEYLRLSVTDRCNLSCRYCRPNCEAGLLPRLDILSYEEMLRLVRLLVTQGIRKIRLTGGEPLLRRGLTEFIANLNDIPELQEITLTTNGLRLRSLAVELRRAGLSRLNISLDSLNPGTFSSITGKPALPLVWEGIEAAREAGFKLIKLNMVVMRGINDHEIPAFVELARKHPYHVRFIEFMPIGYDNEWSRESFLPMAQVMRKVRKVAELIPVARQGLDGPARSFLIKGGLGGVGFISPMSDHFCHQCNRLRLTPEGHLRTCLFGDQEEDLSGLVRGGAKDQDLSDVIRSALESKRPHIEEAGELGCNRPMFNIGG